MAAGNIYLFSVAPALTFAGEIVNIFALPIGAITFGVGALIAQLTESKLKFRVVGELMMPYYNPLNPSDTYAHDYAKKSVYYLQDTLALDDHKFHMPSGIDGVSVTPHRIDFTRKAFDYKYDCFDKGPTTVKVDYINKNKKPESITDIDDVKHLSCQLYLI